MNEVTIYHTTIVKWDENQIILNTGGYNTPTTFRNMNKVGKDLGFTVSCKNYQPFVSYRGHVIEFDQTVTIDRNLQEIAKPEPKVKYESRFLQQLAKQKQNGKNKPRSSTTPQV